jgi:hypothetical protein
MNLLRSLASQQVSIFLYRCPHTHSTLQSPELIFPILTGQGNKIRMTSFGSLDPESEEFSQARPTFWFGQHDSTRTEALTDSQYSHVLNTGVCLLLSNPTLD